MYRIPYKYRTSKEALSEIAILDKEIANYEIAQRIKRDDFNLYNIDQLKSNRRAIINDFNMR